MESDESDEFGSEEGSDDGSSLMKSAFDNTDTAQNLQSQIKPTKIQKIEIDDDEKAGPSSVSLTTSRYNDYVDMFAYDSEDEDEDDMVAAIKASLEDQDRAIQESLQDQGTTSKECSDAKEVIKAFVDNIISSTFKAIERNNFSFNKEVFVVFSGEEGVDAGGPKGEFFCLLMLSLKNVGVFQGNWFSHDIKLLSQRKYELARKLVAWSILHGGPGLKQLSHAALCVLSDLPYDTNDAIASVSDDKMKGILCALEKCTNDEEFNAFKDSNAEAIADYGYASVYTSNQSMKGEIEHSLLKQSLVFSFHAEIEQFKQGLNSIGQFGDTVMSNDKVFKVVLSKDSNEKLSFLSMKKMIQVNYSLSGSNDKGGEDKTMYCFDTFLQDLEEGEVDDLSLRDLLVFITGADSIPPLGFDDPITLNFYDQQKGITRLPWASTRSLTLYLPRGFEDTDEFKHLMSTTLINGVGFGKC